MVARGRAEKLGRGGTLRGRFIATLPLSPLEPLALPLLVLAAFALASPALAPVSRALAVSTSIVPSFAVVVARASAGAAGSGFGVASG